MRAAPGREGLALVALLLVVTALFFFGVTRGDTLFKSDFHQTFQPLRSGLGESLREGLPLWDSRLNNGMPLLGNPMHAVFYPPNLLFAAFPAPRLLGLLTVAHVFFGACGVFLLCRRWELCASAATVAAAAHGFNGTAVAAVAFTNLCWAYAWIPWLLLAWTHVTAPAAERRLPATGALTVVAACMLSLAEPFILLASALGLFLLSAGRLLDRGEGRFPVGPRVLFGLPLLALVLALVLVSPFLVAFVGYAPESERGAGFVDEGLVYWSMHPLLACDLVLPGVFGDPRLEGVRAFWAQKLAPDKGFQLFAGFYVGGLLLGLAAAGTRRRTWPLAAWVLFSFLLALGRWGPVYPWLVSLPLMDMLRYPVKWMLPAMLPLTLLAGYGADRLARGEPREARPLVVVLVAFLVLAGAASVAASPGLEGWLLALANLGASDGASTLEEAGRFIRGQVSGSALRAAIPLLVVLGLVLLGRGRWKLVTTICLPAIVLLDLGSANMRLAPTLPASFYDTPPRAVELIRSDPGGYGRVYVEDPKINETRMVPPPADPEELARWERAAMQGYIGSAYGLRLAFNMDVGHFRPFLYAKLGSMVRTAPLRPKLMLLGSAGVTHLVTFSEFSSEHLTLLEEVPIGADRPQRVARNGLALPRARLVATALAYDGDEGFMTIVDAGPDDLFRRATLIEREELRANGLVEEELAGLVVDGPPAVAGGATILDDRGAAVRVRTTGPGGILVLADSWTGGWRAQVDGRDAPLLRADYAFRAVPVPAGEHEVSFLYSPLGPGG